MKVLIYGAGVLGSLYAALLHESGANVTLLARNQRLKILQEKGVRFTNVFTHTTHQTMVPVVSHVSSKHEYDLIIVVMQKQQVLSVLPILETLSPIPDVLFLGNNGLGEGEYQKYIPADHLFFGFPSAGGIREGDGFRIAYSPESPITLGVTDPALQPRLREIAQFFSHYGIPTTITPDVDAWLKSHVALVIPLALAIYAAAGDNYRLARTPGIIKMGIAAVKEELRVVEHLGYPILPVSLKKLTKFPTFVLSRVFKKRFDSEFAEIAMAGHANYARREMIHLAQELQAMNMKAGLATPKFDYLMKFVNPNFPPVPEGTRKVTLQ